MYTFFEISNMYFFFQFNSIPFKTYSKTIKIYDTYILRFKFNFIAYTATNIFHSAHKFQQKLPSKHPIIQPTVIKLCPIKTQTLRQ